MYSFVKCHAHIDPVSFHFEAETLKKIFQAAKLKTKFLLFSNQDFQLC